MPDVKELYETITRQAPAKPTPEALRDRRDRKRRNQHHGRRRGHRRLRGGRLVVTGNGTDRTRTLHPTEGFETGATIDSPASRHGRLVGFPPTDAAPSSPNRGELVLSFMFGHTNGDPGRFGMHVYADGR